MPDQSNISTRQPILGCIADDVTGATDLALNLVQGGMCVVQVLEVPTAGGLHKIDADAIVVALKTRSIPSDQAVTQSLAALAALEELGVQRFFFKYCSTFDSTVDGNIGPVAAAMIGALGESQTVFCPAFPRNGRTVYEGHLFVNNQLLSESGMQHHPLNPMTDPNLVRFLSRQVSSSVGLLPYETVCQGAAACAAELQRLARCGTSMVITDCLDDAHLASLAGAVADMRLVTGGSGIARYLPEVYRASSLLNSPAYQPMLPNVAGRSLILAGSCSQATGRQVAFMGQRCPSWQLDVSALIQDPESSLQSAIAWARQVDSDCPLLISSTAAADQVASLQKQFGKELVASAVEQFHARVAEALVAEIGVGRLVLAGGETSGAVVNKLGIRALRIGPEICAGVPWTESMDDRPLALALKSGNFGDDDFFERALEMLA